MTLSWRQTLAAQFVWFSFLLSSQPSILCGYMKAQYWHWAQVSQSSCYRQREKSKKQKRQLFHSHFRAILFLFKQLTIALLVIQPKIMSKCSYYKAGNRNLVIADSLQSGPFDRFRGEEEQILPSMTKHSQEKSLVLYHTSTESSNLHITKYIMLLHAKVMYWRVVSKRKKNDMEHPTTQPTPLNSSWKD